MISVIMPVFNVAEFLDEAIQSVLNQTYSDFEFLIIDDGSTDLSPDICDKYEKIDQRIQVIHKQNGGLSDSRNVGINMAKGEYLTFIDSDDTITRDYLEKLHTEILKSEVDMVVGSVSIINEKGVQQELTKYWGKTLKPGLYNRNEYLTAYYNKRQAHAVVAWGKLYKSEVFNYIRFPNGKLNEDEYILYDLLAEVTLISVIEDRIYNYRQRSNSIMSNIVNGRNKAAGKFSRYLSLCILRLKFLVEHPNVFSQDNIRLCVDDTLEKCVQLSLLGETYDKKHILTILEEITTEYGEKSISNKAKCLATNVFFAHLYLNYRKTKRLAKSFLKG
ncbi:glycosyltransferase family 2 protein [Limosilactobacillus fermentum]|uniref:glycosyltransferase family 2 protein n=1 Tax=Limosilactobacillus fermentum TaxID=1613 RepID=UPI0014025ED4|nr:glycosyltransferase family 2 protein [Limosilactobacillus fermentum]